MTKAQQRRRERDRFKLAFRLPQPMFEQLKRLAQREDRSMPYLVRRYIQAGLEKEVAAR